MKNFKLLDNTRQLFLKIKSVYIKAGIENFYLLMIFLILSSFAELMGYASIIPIADIILNGTQKYEQPFLSGILTSPILFLGIILLIYLVIYSIRIITILLQTKFLAEAEKKISVTLFRQYYGKVDTLKKDDSSKVTRSLIQDSNSFSAGVLLPIVNLISGSVLALGFFVISLIANFEITLFLFMTYGIVYGLIVVIVRPRLKMYAEIKITEASARYKIMNETSAQHDEIKVNNAGRFFLKKFDSASAAFLESQRMYSFFNQMPQIIVEFVTVLLCISAILYFKNLGSDSDIGFILFFAIAATRTLPSIQKIYIALNTLQYNIPAINNIHFSLKNVTDLERLDVRKDRFALSLSDIRFRYPESDKFIVDNFNFNISSGDFVRLIGESGAGKSTVAKILAGLLEPDAGEVRLHDEKLINVSQLHAISGYVPQKILLSNENIVSNVVFGSEYDSEKFRQVASVCDLESIGLSLDPSSSDLLGERGQSISGGQQQRIGIARALYKDPMLLIIDEGTSGLDERSEYNILTNVSAQFEGIAFVLISHNDRNLYGEFKPVEVGRYERD